ncbi:UDP-N-acetylmuramate dehydrogenase [Lacicoccus alkaliphilus]|uniref:UDP-N-acetylenolpyruvoylglucosamine reductase n=1 Tax=Lacicoccus alkaliphilus DSM 16010 TaxID=1123231 RepID=A0A1M7F7L9_9BACL|nr:UDP-N-acetylmuramate dehydrogenase [Salinicoccus alkaliphilus]SHM00082.1 UDP-N-acetylmuramate dehydrogenase [Salinicoccus alkaliphilus DSM 16010]
MDKTQIEKDLKTKLTNSTIKIDEPLKNYTYTETGGPADFYVTPKDFEDVSTLLKYCHDNHIPVTYLGNGSNIIIRDGGIRGIVLNLLELTHLTLADDVISVGSGRAIIEVSRFARDNKLSGLEFACGIPGSVGGAVYMNAGAYGGEVKDCLLEATVATEKGELLTLTNEELELGYRRSNIQENHYVILEAKFRLAEGDIEDINAMMNDLTERRESKQPLEHPSCGSVFQRPPGNFAGKLIQDAGLQGHRIGGVEVSKKHAGFMVNVDNGTAGDYEELINFVQSSVKEKYGIELDTEVRVIGEPVYKRADRHK